MASKTALAGSPIPIRDPGAHALRPEALATVAERVDVRLDGFLETELAYWSLRDAALAEPIQALRETVSSGGKRLRPLFCYWAFVGAGGDQDDPVWLDAAAALEFLHTAALIHDDVMDGSTVRRGRQAVYLDFAARHAERGWRGDPRHFGEAVAILIGDLSIVYADVLMANLPRQAVDIFNEARVEAGMGQYRDLAATAQRSIDYEVARWIAVHKSGKYTVERPLQLGAALAGRLDELAEPFTGYGLPLGEAFQLRDDLLGVFGDSSLTGKLVADDLREGKPTPLLAIAARRGGPRQKLLLDRLGSPDLDDAEIEALQSFFVESGALHETELRIERLVARAIEAIEAAPVSEECRTVLAELAAYVAARDR